MGMQALAFRNSLYGPAKFNPNDPLDDEENPDYAPYFMAGWFQSCLVDDGLQPVNLQPKGTRRKRDTRDFYAEFMGLSMMDNRVYRLGSALSLGYPVPPLSMDPPYVPPVFDK